MGELCLQRKVIGESDCKMDELGKVTKKYKTTLHSDAAAVSSLLGAGETKEPRRLIGDNIRQTLHGMTS